MLSFPFPLRFLLATNPVLIGRVLGIVYRVIAGHLIRQAGYTQQSARTGAVTLIPRFGSALRNEDTRQFSDAFTVSARGNGMH